MKRLALLLPLLMCLSALAAGPSSIVWNGGMPDQSTMIQFLNNPTFPAMTVSGPITAPGGVAPTGVAPLIKGNINIGPTALTSIGTNTADVNGQLWITDIFIPTNQTITIIGVLQGGTATTDNILVALYDPTGKLVTTSALTGVVLSGANTFKEITLLNSVTLSGPGTYYIAVQGNGTAAGALQILASPNIQNRTAVVAGTFGTVPATITLPTAWTTGQAPVVYVK